MSKTQTHPSSKKVLWENYKSYLVMNLIGNITYMALMATEDHIRGDRTRSMESYLKEGGVSFLWDSTLSAFHAFYFDKVLLASLPKMRDFISAGVKAKFFSSARWVKVDNEWFLRIIKAPGYGSEIGVRWLYGYLRAYGWQLVASELRK